MRYDTMPRGKRKKKSDLFKHIKISRSLSGFAKMKEQQQKMKDEEETVSLFAQEIISCYVLNLINNEQVMLTSQFSCSFRRLMHGVGSWKGERNQAQRNVKNENWLQKINLSHLRQ